MAERIISQKEYEQAYADLMEPIFRHCYFKTGDREKAKDLTQETFIRTWDYVRQGKKIDNLKAFIYRVAHNLILNEWRDRKNDASLDQLMEDDGFDPGFSPEQSERDRIDGQFALKALGKLEPTYSEPLYMRYIDELPVKEIARMLEETENVVSVRIHRGLAKLRELYERRT